MIETEIEYQNALTEMDHLLTLLREVSEGRGGDEMTIANLHKRLARVHTKAFRFLSEAALHKAASSSRECSASPTQPATGTGA